MLRPDLKAFAIGPRTLILFMACASAASAATWSATDVQLLYGTGARLTPSPNVTILTLEHASGWEYGDNYLFVDIAQPFDPGTSVYAEWHPRFSINRLSGIGVGHGLIRDVLVCSEINIANDWRAFLMGVGFDLNISGFEFFWVDVELRNDTSVHGAPALQVSPSWSLPLSLRKTHLKFAGAINFIGREGASASSIIAQPQLLIDCGHWLGTEGRLFCGVEYAYWRHKYGRENINEHYPQALVQWVF